MNDETMTDSTALPFEKGYPINVSAHNFLNTVESMLVTRASERGIVEVAIQDANVPLTGAMRQDMLLPVLTDYMNFVIHTQADLQFDSAIYDELTAGVAADLATADQREPTVDDVGKADDLVGKILRRTPLINVKDEDAGLLARTRLNDVAGVPLSVTLLMLDTALESAHNLSMQHQQETMGVAESEVLDLTPVCSLLAAMNVSQHLNELPHNVHERLQAILGTQDVVGPEHEPVNPLYDVLSEEAATESDNTIEPEIQA